MVAGKNVSVILMKIANKSTLKKKFLHELRLYILYTLFLMFVFIAFSTYHRLILEEKPFSYIHIEYNLFEALILAKIILIGQELGLGEKFQNRPLIYPTLYKAIVFIFFVFMFSVLEHFLVGLFSGGEMEKLYLAFKGNQIYVVVNKVILLFFVFVLFFAILETNRALGAGQLFNLFFKRNKQISSSGE